MKSLQTVVAPVRPSAQQLGRWLIIVLYTLGFFGVLPSALVRLGQRVDRELGWPELPPLRGPFGAALSLAGSALLLRAAWELWQRGQGLPISHLPPQNLVASGPFRRLRHPIYVGYSLALAGVGLLASSLGIACVATGLLVVAWTGYARCIEEPQLLRRFGADYRRYAQSTVLLPIPARLSASGGQVLAAVWRGLRPPVAWLARQTVLFRIGSTLWVGYGALLAVGAGVGSLLAIGLLSRSLSPRALVEYLLGLSLAMLVGGRLAWLGYEQRAFRQRPRETLKRVGFVSFGAYAAMFGYVAVWSRLHASQLNAGWLLDRTMAAALVCSGFGRLGCLTYGCCYGRVWQHGICYVGAEAKVIRELGSAGTEPRVPTQLLSAALAFGTALVMLASLGAGGSPGFASALGALCYALGRFHLEDLREELRLVSGRLTRGQLLSMVIAGLALAWLAVSPSVHAAVARPALGFAWAELGRHAALPLVAAIPVFLVCGYHRRSVGSW